MAEAFAHAELAALPPTEYCFQQSKRAAGFSTWSAAEPQPSCGLSRRDKSTMNRTSRQGTAIRLRFPITCWKFLPQEQYKTSLASSRLFLVLQELRCLLALSLFLPGLKRGAFRLSLKNRIPRKANTTTATREVVNTDVRGWEGGLKYLVSGPWISSFYAGKRFAGSREHQQMSGQIILAVSIKHSKAML